MQNLVAFFPIILLFVIYAAACLLYAAYIKLSAKLLRDSFVSWKHSMIFAVVIAVATLFARMGTVAGDTVVPFPWVYILGFALYMAFGGWFFSSRGMSKEGRSFGWLGGIQLSGLAFLLFFVTSVLAKGVAHALAMAVKS